MPKPHGINAGSFDHVTLICGDLVATRRFYIDFLGMLEVERPAFKFPGLWFELGGIQIHATQQSPEAGPAGWAPGGSITSRSHHIAFAVDDVSKTLDVVAAHGIRIASPPQKRPDGFQQLYLYDPDGHLVELVSK
jgi:catechol 2,3-dioxygenase-like lactoylglutathione lyase family enzyme